MTLTSGSLDISWNLLVSSFSRPTPHCSTRFWPPQMLCSNTSPNHLDFRLHDSGMPWVFLGWTSQKIRILGSKFLLRFFASLLSCCVHQLMVVPASVEVNLPPRSGREAFEGSGASGVHRPQDVSQSHWGLAVFFFLKLMLLQMRRNIFFWSERNNSRIKH